MRHRNKDILSRIEDVTVEPESEEMNIECQNVNHTHDNNIREGRRAYLVFTKADDEWNLHTVICLRCSISDTVERISQNDVDIAVVEGLVITDLSDQTPVLRFTDLKIWDVMKN